MTSQRIGDYRLLARLGRGSLTEVFLAAGSGAAQASDLVVIKRLRRELSPPLGREQAAQRAVLLLHPQIARTLEAGRAGDGAYHVQEYLEGQPLDRVLSVASRSHGLSRELGLSIVCDVLAALEHAHAAGVVHGALRPHNVYLTYDGEVKLLDCGAPWLPRSADLLQEAAAYLAPEQRADALTVEPASDVFAAGILLRECLLRAQPLTGDALAALPAQLAQRPLPGLGVALPELPPVLADVAERCVRLEPRDRKLTAADARGALGPLAGDPAAQRAALRSLLNELFETELRQRAQRVAELAGPTRASKEATSAAPAAPLQPLAAKVAAEPASYARPEPQPMAADAAQDGPARASVPPLAAQPEGRSALRPPAQEGPPPPRAARVSGLQPPAADVHDFDDLLQGPARRVPPRAPSGSWRASEPPPPPPPPPRASRPGPPPPGPRSSSPRPALPQAREDADSLLRLSIPRSEPAPSAPPPAGSLRKRVASLVAVLLPLVVFGIGLWATRSQSATTRGAGPAAAPAAISSNVDRLEAPGAELALRLCGSNTIGSELAPALVEAFLADKAGSHLARRRGEGAESVSISAQLGGARRAVEIRAGGSATAFSGLADGSCDLGMASRAIQPAEAEALRERGHGDLRSSATEHVIALDGIAVIVHPDSPLHALDRAALHDVFTGKISDWSQLGAAAGPIEVLARDDRSGTYDTFKQLVLAGDPLAPGARRFADSEALSDAVAAEPRAIGFVGFAYVRAARALAVGEPGAAPMLPSLFTVGTESYMLSRRLYLYSLPRPRVPWVTELISFALSRRAQDVVARSGFIGLGVSLQAASCEHGCPDAYQKATAGAERASLDFRFRSGTSEPDSRAGRDFERLVSYLAELRASKVILLGFSDSHGQPAVNDKLSLARAQAVHHELQLRGVHAARVQGFGAALPVADNASEDGRQRNRRVEVWVVR